MNVSRATVLGRIRRALVHPGRKHTHGQQGQVTDMRELFASEALDSSSLVKRFREESERVGGATRFCEGVRDTLRNIQDLVAGSGYRKVVVSNHAICRRLRLVQELSAAMPEVSLWSESLDPESDPARRRNSRSLAQADLSVTGAEYLIAESGTVVLSTQAAASRQISLLPAAHLVLATEDQIYPSLAAVFEHLATAEEGLHPPAALTLITGPSRTADIEKVLIKGVHGPVKQLIWVMGTDSQTP